MKHLEQIAYWFLLVSASVLSATLITSASNIQFYDPPLVNVHRSDNLTPAEMRKVCSLDSVTGPACAPYEKQVSGIASYLVYQLHDSCAARAWAKGTRLLVHAGERWVVCTVRDFGPGRKDRIIDLNRDQFVKLASTRQGLVHVTITEI